MEQANGRRETSVEQRRRRAEERRRGGERENISVVPGGEGGRMVVGLEGNIRGGKETAWQCSCMEAEMDANESRPQTAHPWSTMGSTMHLTGPLPVM